MNYSQKFFRKNIDELVEEDLLNFFKRQIEESDILEIKSYIANSNGHKEKEKKIALLICN